MNASIKTLMIAIFALLLGLGMGYLIFDRSNEKGNQNNIDSINQPVEETADEVWTCSMHPQIRQNESGLCPICEMDLTILETSSSSDPLVLEMTPEAVQLANIQTSIVGENTAALEKQIRLTGRVKADERLASSQVAHLPGRIEKLYVTFTGEKVNKGQKLATLYVPELITAQRELLEAIQLQNLNPALLTAARNKMKYWKIDSNTIKRIEESGQVQENFDLFAEESGIVTNRRVAVGDHVHEGQALFDLMSLDKVWILFDAYEEDLAHIQLGQIIAFTTPSIPAKTFRTRITFIDPVIDPNTRVAALRTELSNANGNLKPEMFVNGTLRQQLKNDRLLTVPKSAVLWTGLRSVVYVKMPDANIPSFQFREVEIGESLGTEYQVLSGLALGEEVVTYGSFSIDAAAQLNNQASMMNQSVTIIKEENEEIPNFHAVNSTAFRLAFSNLLRAYFDLKDAFVATDANAATSSAEQFLVQLEKVGFEGMENEAQVYWSEKAKAFKTHGRKITQTKDVENQRTQFGFLSEALITTVEAFGTDGTSVFVQHCPMAFDNEGGDWLAREEAIKNPYFGDRMMRCGFVKKTFDH
ncbi:MAG: efflux RND transporter periplasmic adaptor subunit [Bacteroidota bacterium]